MKLVKLLISDSDKFLHVAIPVAEANRQYRLTIVIEASAEGTCNFRAPCRSWPAGFFENTVGKWVGEFERPPQVEFEKREEL